MDRSGLTARRRIVVRVLAVAAAIVTALVVAPPASAHDELYEVVPGAGETVTVPPTAVKLTFGASPMSMGLILKVTGPDGSVVSSGPAVISGISVSQPLVTGLKPGPYTVIWRVTASDGHPVSNSYTWTLAAPGANAPATPGGAESTSTTGTGTTGTTGSTGTTGGSGESGSGPGTGLVVGLVVLVVLAAAGGTVILRRRGGGASSNEGNRS